MEQDTIKLTWEDLIVDNITQEEATAWMTEWPWLVSGQLYPVFVSRFGNWFLRRPNGSTDLLDVHEGTLETIATDPAQFEAAVNSRNWQEQYLYSALVMQYRRQGIVAHGRDAIAHVPHPVLVDRIERCQIMVMQMNAWQSICGQTMHQNRQ